MTRSQCRSAVAHTSVRVATRIAKWTAWVLRAGTSLDNIGVETYAQEISYACMMEAERHVDCSKVINSVSVPNGIEYNCT